MRPISTRPIRMRRHARGLVAPLLALAPLAAAAECPTPEAVAAYAAAVAAATPAAPPVAPDAPMSEAVCAQEMLVDLLGETLGEIVGWKAGLTSPATQARFGVDQPVLGTLLAGMMLEDGARVVVAEGVNPLFEADLIVEIASDEVASARTPEEVLEHVAGIRAFIELPDLPFPQGAPITGAVLTASNVGAWRGVLGPLVEIPQGPEGVAMLAEFTARLTDASGAELSAAPGSVVLGHPLEAVIWVSRALIERGGGLGQGDLVSVGSIGPLLPMKPGMTVTMTYDGLPGTPRLSVSFH